MSKNAMQLQNYKIDVVMPCYNCEDTLTRVIDSVLKQDCLNQFIIIDDGSTDRSNTILKRYEANPKIVIKKNAINMGLAYSLNKAIALSTADIISRIDSDDIMLTGRLTSQYNYFLNNPQVDVLGGNARVISATSQKDTDQPTNDTQIKSALKKYNPILHPTVSFKKARIVEIGGYNEKYRRAQDFDLWIRCSHAGLIFANQKEVQTIIVRNTNRSLKSILQEAHVISIIAIKKKSLVLVLSAMYTIIFNLYGKFSKI